MASPAERILPLQHFGALTTALLAAAVLFASMLASMAIALANLPYFELVNRFVGATETVARGMLFSSWLLLIGGLVVVWRPAFFGLRPGDLRREWRIVAVVTVMAAFGTAVLLTVTGTTPYSDASLFIETIVVLLTEELVFRAVLLTLLLVVLARIVAPTVVVPLAVVANGIGFGLAHLTNALDLSLTFVLGQAAFATVLGMACAALMVRARSVYAAMLLHGAVNAVVVLI